MPTKSIKQFAICINNLEYPASLEMYKVYRVRPDKQAEMHGDIRVIDESGEDYLYHKSYFLFVDFPPAVTKRILALEHAN